jgi:hypothetical protein
MVPFLTRGWVSSLQYLLFVIKNQSYLAIIKNGFSGMLRRLAPVRTGVSEELSASIIRVRRIDELGTLVVTSNRCTLRNSISSQRAS